MPATFTHKGQPVDRETVSEKARQLMDAVDHAEQQIRQLQNEWAIADTARLAYSAALRREVRTRDKERGHG